MFDFSDSQCSIFSWNSNADWYWQRAIDSWSPKAEICPRCHFPLHRFCNNSLAQRWNNSAFLTCLPPLSLLTPLARSVPPSHSLPVSPNISRMFSPSLIHCLPHILCCQPLCVFTHLCAATLMYEVLYTLKHTSTQHTNMHIHHWWQLSLHDYCYSKLLRGSVPSGSGVCSIIHPPYLAPHASPLSSRPSPVSSPAVHFPHTPASKHTQSWRTEAEQNEW